MRFILSIRYIHGLSLLSVAIFQVSPTCATILVKKKKLFFRFHFHKHSKHVVYLDAVRC